MTNFILLFYLHVILIIFCSYVAFVTKDMGVRTLNFIAVLANIAAVIMLFFVSYYELIIK